MTLHRRNFLCQSAAAMLCGCAAPQARDYVAERPLLDLQKYFDGDVRAWGMFTDRAGRVVKRFTVILACRWIGNEGTLDERFSYSDGSTQRRTWRVQKTGEGTFTGRAADVIGEASGVAKGNAIHWTYVLALPVDGRTWHVDMDDWMHLIDEKVLLNRTTMSKFGVRLGEVTLAFQRG